MNILVVSSYLPYPLFSGGHIRLYNLIKELSKHNAITLICEKRFYQTQTDIDALRELCEEVITVERKRQWSLKNVIQTGFSTYPFLMVGHMNREMTDEIKNVIKRKKFDILHVETFYVMQNLPTVTLPIVLAEHNVEYLVYKRFARQSPFIVRSFLSIDVLKMKFWEREYWRKVERVITVSAQEKRIIGEKAIVVSNGVDVQKFSMKIRNNSGKKKEKRILFIGDFKWIQNRDAAEWLLKEIWNKVQEQESSFELKLWIVSRRIPSYLRGINANRSILFDDKAPIETQEIFEKADILLAPIRVGGGTKFKILEAMASGVPVVTTSLGIEGIHGKNNQSVLLANTIEEFAAAVDFLLEDEKFYKEIASNARKLIESEYDWKIIVKKLEKVYESVVRRSA